MCVVALCECLLHGKKKPVRDDFSMSSAQQEEEPKEEVPEPPRAPSPPPRPIPVPDDCAAALCGRSA